MTQKTIKKLMNNSSIKKLLELKENFAGGMSSVGAPIAPMTSTPYPSSKKRKKSNLIIKNKYPNKYLNKLKG